MASIVPVYRRCRKNFSKIKEVMEISNLIEVQKRSYEQFLQADVDPDKREPVGLQAVFRTVFPIKDFYLFTIIPRLVRGQRFHEISKSI